MNNLIEIKKIEKLFLPQLQYAVTSRRLVDDQNGINFYEDDATKLKIYKAFMHERNIASLNQVKNKIMESEDR